MHPLFKLLGGNGNPLDMLQRNPLGILGMIQQNPLAILGQVGMNAPQGMNNPQAIIQHLLDSGQISQSQLNRAIQETRKRGF